MSLRIFGPARDLTILALADPTNGFNATLASLITEFSLPPMAIDFADNSKNFVQKKIARDSPDIDFASHLICRPLGLAMYVAGAISSGDQTSTLFAGKLIISLDFYVRLRQRELPDDQGGSWELDGNDTETIVHAITEAAKIAMYYYPSNGSATYDRQPNNDRGDVLLYPDGYMQRTSLDLSFEVTAR